MPDGRQPDDSLMEIEQKLASSWSAAALPFAPHKTNWQQFRWFPGGEEGGQVADHRCTVATEWFRAAVAAQV